MRDLNKDFGAAVSEARRKLGLTQVGLTEELGKTDRSISDMENGKTTPKLDTVALFARRLGSALTQQFMTRRKAMFRSASSSFSAV